MNRASLTTLYLDEVKRRGLGADDLRNAEPESEMSHAFYGGRNLPRPLFLGHAEKEQLHADLVNVRSALAALPDRLFGGDTAAFARAVGMTELQVRAIESGRSREVTRQARADMYADERGFRLLEFNMGSSLGGMDNADLMRRLLAHPVLAEFVETHRLEYVDTLREQVNDIFTESGFDPSSFPTMAMVDWPSSFGDLEPYMRLYAERFRELGLNAYPCHIGQLSYHDGAVWLGDRKVDIIDRMFMIEDVLESPDAPGLMFPLLEAGMRGEVAICMPMDSHLCSSKGALAMLSDEANRSRLAPTELASLDRILPWTRMVRPGPVTLEDGRRVDLLEYALSHRDDLALKPTAMHGGNGVVCGWQGDVTAEAWAEQVRAAMDGPYVIQRRVRPVPEMFPADDGGLEPWVVCWGVFTVDRGYGGAYARAFRADADVHVFSLGAGATVGSALHAPAEEE
jgi:hypothetical protein